jgi:hypothetical protein
MASFWLLKANNVKCTKEDKKNFLICTDMKKKEIFFPKKAVQCFVALCVCVCARTCMCACVKKKPLNSHWSDFVLKLCQNMAEREIFLFSLIYINQIPGAFLLSNYSCDSDHMCTPNCKNGTSEEEYLPKILVQTLMSFYSQMSLANSLQPAHPERSMEVA